MTYFGFLLRFLVIPIIVLWLLLAWARRHEDKRLIIGRAFWVALGVQVLLAVVYTTPWDNYLVAHRVWFYNPAQVSGVLLGYVPLEEYCFFVLQAILVGLCWLLLAPYLPDGEHSESKPGLRLWSCAAVLMLWLGALIVLIANWKPGTYLGLILVWALPPIAIQLGFGADILWGRRAMAGLLVFAPALYLGAADSLAIAKGIWAIDPAQSTGLFIGGLPMEEGLFFLVTVVLLAFGMMLSLAPESRARLGALRERLLHQPALTKSRT